MGNTMEWKQPDMRIKAACAMFVCRMCRTKTGWKHQPWCALLALKKPTCKDCRYWSADRQVCAHPAAKRVGGAV